jgi:hypothetical protein
MVGSLVDTFGGTTVSYLVDSSERLNPEQIESLRTQAAHSRKKESLHE